MVEMREQFEKIPYVKSRLDDVFFVDEENTYLPHQWDDGDSVNNMQFINGAWYAFQEQQKIIDSMTECMDDAIRLIDEGNSWDAKEVLK